MVNTIGKAGIRPHYPYLKHYLAKEKTRNTTILDVGCGPGDLYCYLAKFGEVNYTGCDLTTEMLEEARNRCPGIEFFECDVQLMDNVQDNSYDWVVCSDVLIHVAQPYEGFKNLWRCARGGLLVAVRDSDYSEDIVDIERSFQTDKKGTIFNYNIFNKTKLLEFIQKLEPRPLDIDISFNTCRTEKTNFESKFIYSYKLC